MNVDYIKPLVSYDIKNISVGELPAIPTEVLKRILQAPDNKYIYLFVVCWNGEAKVRKITKVSGGYICWYKINFGPEDFFASCFQPSNLNLNRLLQAMTKYDNAAGWRVVGVSDSLDEVQAFFNLYETID